MKRKKEMVIMRPGEEVRMSCVRLKANGQKANLNDQGWRIYM
ncbi:MAG TPA: hypothetical protein VI423_04320 [Paenisporosarcina sp.]|nr:hypothetical protein [Paenisporosarcina sp.]